MNKLLISLLATLTISSKLLSIGTEGIALKLGQKPKSVKTYDWCNKIANDFVREKRQAILNILGIKSEKEWTERKKYLEKKYKKKIKIKFETDVAVTCNNQKCKNQELILKNAILEAILKVIRLPFVQKELGITNKDISTPFNILTIKRNNETETKFLNVCCFSRGGHCSTDFTDIYICQEIFEKYNLSINGLEGAIAHELAHILSKHNSREESTDKDFFYFEYCETVKNQAFEKEFLQACFNWQIAQEIQADIVGIFNNPDLANSMILHIKEYSDKNIENSHKCECENCLNKECKSGFQDFRYKTHPPYEERIKYLDAIHKELINEREKH